MDGRRENGERTAELERLLEWLCDLIVTSPSRE
jgi:hypothetical protein